MILKIILFRGRFDFDFCAFTLEMMQAKGAAAGGIACRFDVPGIGPISQKSHFALSPFGCCSY